MMSNRLKLGMEATTWLSRNSFVDGAFFAIAEPWSIV